MADIFRNSSSRRAARACLRCRYRRVRCDVTRTELPCTNCRRDEKDCVVVSRSRMRQAPLVEDVRTVKRTEDEPDQGGQPIDFPPETEVTTRERQTSNPPDTENVEKPNAQSGLEEALADRLETQAYTTSEAPMDTYTEGQDLVDVAYLPSAEFVDAPWADVADRQQEDLPRLDSMEFSSYPHTPAFADSSEKQPLQRDPMLFTIGGGGWYAPTSEDGWGSPRNMDEIHEMVTHAVHSMTGHLARDDGCHETELQIGCIPNDKDRYDRGAKATPRHHEKGGSEIVSGWIQNDRSLYYLHEIGIL